MFYGGRSMFIDVWVALILYDGLIYKLEYGKSIRNS